MPEADFLLLQERWLAGLSRLFQVQGLVWIH
jgi:hypothetical protein